MRLWTGCSKNARELQILDRIKGIDLPIEDLNSCPMANRNAQVNLTLVPSQSPTRQSVKINVTEADDAVDIDAFVALYVARVMRMQGWTTGQSDLKSVA